jgi:plasmid stabilization system protein ParE
MSPHFQLEQAIALVEQHLGALGEAMRVHHAEAVESEAAALQRALAAAVEQLRQSARSGSLPPPLRQRLARAGGHVAAQREALARASASLDRAIEVLLPAAATHVAYSAAGLNERQAYSAVAQA